MNPFEQLLPEKKYKLLDYKDRNLDKVKQTYGVSSLREFSHKQLGQLHEEMLNENSLLIEGRFVTPADIGTPVTYLPPHTRGNMNHEDVQRGNISSFNDTYVYVRFNSPNGQACNPDQLRWG